jgi:hypothetical protein
VRAPVPRCLAAWEPGATPDSTYNATTLSMSPISKHVVFVARARFCALRVIQLLSSVLEYVGAVYARNHEFLRNNGSLAAQPLTLMVPGSCLNWQVVLVVSGACSIHTLTARFTCTPTTSFLHIQHGRRELSKQDSPLKRTQLCM